MDEISLWRAIGHVVESGVEEPLVDLKRQPYDLKPPKGKGEFVKDVAAIANTLASPDDRGFLVFGILDASKCPDRSDPTQYTYGFEHPDPDEFSLQMMDILRYRLEPCPVVEYIETCHPRSNGTLVSVLVIRGWKEGIDHRPYVIRESVGSLMRSQVWVRRGTKADPASRDEIVRFIYSNITSRHKQELARERRESEKKLEAVERKSHTAIGELTSEHAREVEWLNQRHAREIDLLQEVNDDLNTYVGELEGSTRELELLKDQVEGLRAERHRLLGDSSDWQLLARGACQKLYRALASESQDEEIRQLLASYEKQDSYEEWFGG